MEHHEPSCIEIAGPTSSFEFGELHAHSLFQLIYIKEANAIFPEQTSISSFFQKPPLCAWSSYIISLPQYRWWPIHVDFNTGSLQKVRKKVVDTMKPVSTAIPIVSFPSAATHVLPQAPITSPPSLDYSTPLRSN